MNSTKMKCYLTFITILLNAYSVKFYSQNIELKGFVSSGKKGVEDAIIQLLKASDSTLVKNEITDKTGSYTFSGLDSGSYFLQVNAIGYTRTVSPVFNCRSSQQLNEINLQRSELNLKEVTVVTKKPYIERNKGIVTLNVESSVNAEGSSAFELLEKAPGIRVDNNENISLNGKPGTTIWIDGKPSLMQGADLTNFLRGMSSSLIDKIEIISNPSARYDAAGSAIVNIKLKKDKRIGTNGSVSGSYGQGVFPKYNSGLSINHRDKKISTFGSYNYSNREVFSRLVLDRNFAKNDSFIGAYVQDNYFKYNFNTHSVRTGIDYFADKKNTFGILLNGSGTDFRRDGKNVSEVFDHTHSQTSVFNTINKSKDGWRNYSANLNYRHTFDSLGTEFSSDIDFARFGNNSIQNFETRYYDLSYIEFQKPYILSGDLGGKLDLYSFKCDLTKTYNNDFKSETGLKSSYVIADNELSFFDKSNGTQIYDSSKSNHFIYTENINAAYFTLSGNIKKWSIQLGLRGEHTFVTGKQLVYNSKFERNYVQLFPSTLIGYQMNDHHTLELNYSRRIRRPSYEQLNPFKFYLDPTTYKEGNPYLQPSITESIEFSHIFRKKIYTTLGFGRTFNNIIETISPLQDQPRITVQTNRNLSMVDVYALNAAVPVDVLKWWSTTNDINIYYALYNGNIANTTLRNTGNLNFSINSVNSFNINSTLSGEVSANFRTREVYAYDIIQPIFFVNAGIQKKVLNNKGTLRVNINDIFYSNRIRATVQFTDYTEHFIVERDTRVVTVSFNYKFGKSSVPASKRRQGGAEDIKQRAGGSVG
jgi:hypothetical protein